MSIKIPIPSLTLQQKEQHSSDLLCCSFTIHQLTFTVKFLPTMVPSLSLILTLTV